MWFSRPRPQHFTSTTQIIRSRTLTVPNVGALVGATFRIENVKVSSG